jgi:hypothetical protein
VTRRPGLVHVAGIGAPARLVPFEFNTEQAYLLVFTPGYVVGREQRGCPRDSWAFRAA